MSDLSKPAEMADWIAAVVQDGAKHDLGRVYRKLVQAHAEQEQNLNAATRVPTGVFRGIDLVQYRMSVTMLETACAEVSRELDKAAERTVNLLGSINAVMKAHRRAQRRNTRGSLKLDLPPVGTAAGPSETSTRRG